MFLFFNKEIKIVDSEKHGEQLYFTKIFPIMTWIKRQMKISLFHCFYLASEKNILL